MKKHTPPPPDGTQMRKIAARIKKMIPERFGFTLIVFPFYNPGIANYISNAKREDMIKALEEKLKVLKEGRDFSTPENN